jgi:hypothetical protein
MDANGCAANVGRTTADFQCDVRIVNGLLARWRHLAGVRVRGASETNKKGRREAGLSVEK